MSKKRDTFGAIWNDAKAIATARAQRVVEAVKPHATLDNAVKVLGVVNAALGAAEAARRLATPAPAPPPAPPPAPATRRSRP